MLGRPTRVIQSCQRRSRITNCTSSQKGIPKGAAACERRPLWRASLVTFLHEQESDIPPLFARRRKFPATRSVAKVCASSNPARRRRRQPQAPPRAAWHPSPQAASGGIARDAFFLAKSTPLAAARQFTPQKSAFTEKEFRSLRRAAKGAAFGIRSLYKGWRNFGSGPPPRATWQNPVPAATPKRLIFFAGYR